MRLLIAAILSLGIGATLGALGGGGSTLTLPMLVYVLGVAPQPAMSTALFVCWVTSTMGAVVHARAGRVAWRVGAFFALAGLVGAYGGGRLSHVVPARALLAGFGLLMLLASLLMMRGRRDPEPGSAAAFSVSKSMTLGAGVGALSGLLGAGGGFLIVPALELVGGLGLADAIGTSPLVVAIQALAGLVGRLGSFELDWRLAGVVSAVAVLGCIAGARVAHRLSTRSLRRGFAWVVLALAVVVLARQLPAGWGRGDQHANAPGPRAQASTAVPI